MGLRKDFLAHKRKTIESFGFVRADISALNMRVESMQNLISLVESRLPALGNEVVGLQKSIDSCSSEINAQNSSNLALQSKIIDMNKSIKSTVDLIGSFKNKINGLVSRDNGLLRRINAHDKLLKKLAPSAKKQSLKSDKLILH